MNQEPIRPPKHGSRKRACSVCGRPAVFKTRAGKRKRDMRHDLCQACLEKMQSKNRPNDD